MFGLQLDPFAYTWPGALVPYTDTTGRTTASPTLDPAKKNFIAIIEGQSLAACHIPYAYSVLNPTKVRCVNWAGDRLLYQHKEPMMGGSFFEAGHIPANNWDNPYISLWGKVGDLLIASGWDTVTWLNTSIGGAQVNTFAPGGNWGRRLPAAFHVLRTLGYSGNQVTAILSMIGESDSIAGTSVATYQAHRLASARVARSYGFTGKWIVPLESYAKDSPPSSTIRQAQAELAAMAGFGLGPDFDLYDSTYRDANGTHPNALGHDAMAPDWATVIAARFS